jgi:hypothetical protein
MKFCIKNFVVPLTVYLFCLNAAAVESIYSVSGSHSSVENACVGPIPLFIGLDCSYDASNPTLFPVAGWAGPRFSVGYYPIGSSPGPFGTPAVNDGKLSPEIMASSSITINDNGTFCDLDDTIAINLIFAAAARNFTAGPGARGEESWGDGDLMFQISPTPVNSATGNLNGGCDYTIATAGMPPLLERSDGFGSYPVEEGSWSTGFFLNPSLIGMASFEGVPNIGVAISVLTGASYACVENSPGPCDTGSDGANNFRGSRATINNALVSVATDSLGNITAGRIFDNNESKVFQVPPDPFNSWDGGVIDFSGTLANGRPQPQPPAEPPITPVGFCVEPPESPPGYGQDR